MGGVNPSACGTAGSPTPDAVETGPVPRPSQGIFGFPGRAACSFALLAVLCLGATASAASQAQQALQRAVALVQEGRLEEAGVEQAMGGGDIKMMMMVGAFLGAWGVALTTFLGSVLALVTVLGRSIPAALSRDEDGVMEMGRLIPFGVFLAVGGAISYVWGDAIVAWYVTSLLGMPI